LSDSARDLDAIWVRVDDRLIHGQVTVGWRQHLRYAEIWVVDDGARDDPYLQDALRLAAPEGVAVRVLGVEETVGLIWPPPQPSPVQPTGVGDGRTPGEGDDRAPPRGAQFSSSPPWPDRRRRRRPRSALRGRLRGGGVLLLLRSPETALALVVGGVPLQQLNVGNLASRPGSVRAFKNISLTRAHVQALDALAARGVRITFQLAPEDAQADWQNVRRRLVS
jgi:PTS system mannose-specific IIB component